MAPRTVTIELADALADLSEADFKKFCHRLLHRRAGPRVVRSRVEGKCHLGVTDVLVSTFTEAGALTVALDILRDMECNQEAARLEQAVAALSNPSPSSSPSPSPSSSSASAPGSRNQHFVDRHMAELVQSATNVDPIMDVLLQDGFLQREAYKRIRGADTVHEQMRQLLVGPLSACTAAKDRLYQLLLAHEPYLMEHLHGQQ